jgi:hypothetical protein
MVRSRSNKPRSLLGPTGLLSPPNSFGGSSGVISGASSFANNSGLSAALNQVVPLDECDVYSWFPEPEYDPHVDPEDDEEASEEEYSDDEEMLLPVDVDMEVDGDGHPSWGQAGMDLDDDVPALPLHKGRSFSGSGVNEKRRSSEGDMQFGFHMTSSSPAQEPEELWSGARNVKIGEILWSVNYFFYSR